MTGYEVTTKRRPLVFRDDVWYYGTFTSSSNNVNPHDASITGRQETTSQNNADWVQSRRLLRNPRYRGPGRERLERILDVSDMGAGFQSYSNYYDDNSYRMKAVRKAGVLTYVFDGKFYAHRAFTPSTETYWPNLGKADMFTVLKNGATAIARCKPNNPTANSAQFLGELREELPTVPLLALRDQASHFRSLGSEYLNVEFGWLPFIGDLQRTVVALRNRNKIIAQLLRDSDKIVRRRYAFPSVREQTVTDLGLYYPYPATPFPSVMPGIQYTKTLTEVTGRNDWFEGKFRYHIPGGDDLLSKLQRFDALSSKLLGTRITPDVLWELTPWSWLVDWFGNFGDIINNFSNLNQDNQVMTYGYSMSTVYKENIYDLPGSPIGPLTQKFGSQYKLRLKASPYGFGVDWPDFSAYQLAILAALGISRR